MADINAIAEQIQGLTLLEASSLVKLLEEKLRRPDRRRQPRWSRKRPNSPWS